MRFFLQNMGIRGVKRGAKFNFRQSFAAFSSPLHVQSVIELPIPKQLTIGFEYAKDFKKTGKDMAIRRAFSTNALQDGQNPV